MIQIWYLQDIVQLLNFKSNLSKPGKININRNVEKPTYNVEKPRSTDKQIGSSPRHGNESDIEL